MFRAKTGADILSWDVSHAHIYTYSQRWGFSNYLYPKTTNCKNTPASNLQSTNLLWSELKHNYRSKVRGKGAVNSVLYQIVIQLDVAEKVLLFERAVSEFRLHSCEWVNHCKLLKQVQLSPNTVALSLNHDLDDWERPQTLLSLLQRWRQSIQVRPHWTNIPFHFFFKRPGALEHGLKWTPERKCT